MKKCVLVALMALAPMALAANLVEMSLDSQVNLGSGDAIYAQANGFLVFPGNEGDDLGVEMHMTVNGWWYGPRINFGLAGYPLLDLSDPAAEISFDAKAFQGAPNTNPYGDCNIFVRIYDVNGVFSDFGIVYGPNDQSFPFGDWSNWNRVYVDVAAGTPQTNFDVTQVAQLRFYGTDWTATTTDPNPPAPVDYITVKDLVITPEPGTLVLLGLGLLAGLRRR